MELPSPIQIALRRFPVPARQLLRTALQATHDVAACESIQYDDYANQAARALERLARLLAEATGGATEPRQYVERNQR